MAFQCILIAIAPVLGHVFSPFLKFRGGKAIAVSLGVWIGLTIWKASLVGVTGTVIGIALMTSTGVGGYARIVGDPDNIIDLDTLIRF